MEINLGIAYRDEFSENIEDIIDRVNSVEIMSSGMYHDDFDKIQYIYDMAKKKGKNICIHSTALSIGSAILNTDELRHFRLLCESFPANFVSDHFSFREIANLNSSNFIPPLDMDISYNKIGDNIKEVQDVINRHISLENVAHLIGSSDSIFKERDELVKLCESKDCRILLDVNNVLVDSVNYNFSPIKYIDGIPTNLIDYIHIAGYSNDNGYLVDTHMEEISDLALELLQHILLKDNVTNTVVLERDNNSASIEEIYSEFSKLRSIGSLETSTFVI